MRVGYELTMLELSRTGSARAATTLATALADRPDVDLVPLAQPPPRAGLSGRAARGLARELLWMPHGLRRRAGRDRLDLLHLPGPQSPPAGRVPVAVSVFDTFPWDRPAWASRAMRLQHRLRLGPALQRVAAVLAPSRYTADSLIARFDLDPALLHVTPYGVGAPFTPGPPSDAVLARLGVRSPYLLGVASTVPRKNLAGLLSVFEALAGAGLEHELVLVGHDGPRDRELARRIVESPVAARIRRPGWVSDADLADLYRGADAFVFPTLSEGFGFPVIEAMACGTPVVATRTGSLPELAGHAAVLVEPGDGEAVAGAVRALVDSPAARRDLVERGARRAASFTWRRSAELTAGAYRAALERAA